MFFSINSVAPMVLGVALLLLAPRIADKILQISEERWFATPKFRNLFFVWPIRLMGIILLGFGFWILIGGPL